MFLGLLVVMVLAFAAPALANNRGGNSGREFGTIYVRSQGLYFDTLGAADPLPMHGPFQKLEDGATDVGPGEEGFYGGRWWIDVNGNNVMDEGDHFFLCPLLGPGRATP